MEAKLLRRTLLGMGESGQGQLPGWHHRLWLGLNAQRTGCIRFRGGPPMGFGPLHHGDAPTGNCHPGCSWGHRGAGGQEGGRLVGYRVRGGPG